MHGKEIITVRKCTLARLITKRKDKKNGTPVKKRIMDFMEETVVNVSMIRKQVAMTVKEVYIRKLERGECDLPRLDAKFYQAVYYHLLGKSSEATRERLGSGGGEGVFSGPNARKMLPKLAKAVEKNARLMNALVDMEGRRFKSGLETHLKMHYDQFFARWKRAMVTYNKEAPAESRFCRLCQMTCNDTCSGTGCDTCRRRMNSCRKDELRHPDSQFQEYHLSISQKFENGSEAEQDDDEGETKSQMSKKLLNKMLRNLYQMRKDMESVGAAGFALIPEAGTKVAGIWFTRRILFLMFKQLWKEDGNPAPPACFYTKPKLDKIEQFA